MSALLKAVDDNLPLPSDQLTVATFAQDWLDSIRSSIKPKTFEGYESNVRIHTIPNLGAVRLSKLTPAHLSRLYTDMSNSGLSPRTVRAAHACIHNMLEKTIRLGVVVRNVAKLVDLPRQVRRELPMLTPAEARAFMDVTEGHRLEALFILAITCGARQGELLGLSWNDVDLENREIEIRLSLQKVDGELRLMEPKTKSSVRRIALTDQGATALRRHRVRQAEEALANGRVWNNSLDLVFTSSTGTPVDKTNLTKRQFKPLLRKAGLPNSLRFHDLRHIAASLALGHGMPITAVSAMLGHADASTTLECTVMPSLERNDRSQMR